MSAANFQFAIANIVEEPSLVKLKNSLALPTEHARSGRTTHHSSATLESQPSRRSHQGYATREHDKDKENDQVLQQHSAQGRTISVSLHSIEIPICRIINIVTQCSSLSSSNRTPLYIHESA